MTLLTPADTRRPKPGLELSFHSSLGLVGISAHSERAKKWLMNRFGEKVTEPFEPRLRSDIPNLGSVTVTAELAANVEAEAANLGFVTQWNPASQKEIDLEEKHKNARRARPNAEKQLGTELQSAGETPETKSRSPYRQNAFFLLDARADATTQHIRRLQNRAEVLLEMRKPLESSVLPFLRRAHVTREDILSAVQKLEDGQSRIREELQWLHAGPKGDCLPAESASLASLTALLSTLSKGDGRQGAIATHNLAVLSHALAFEQENTSGASVQSLKDAWTGALSLWQSVYKKEEFWDFMSERVLAWRDPSVSDGDLQQARKNFAEQLLLPHRQLAAEYFASGAYDFARIHLQVMHTASSWIGSGKRMVSELATEMVRHARSLLDEALLAVREDVLSPLESAQKRDRLTRAEIEIVNVGSKAIANLTLFPEMQESNEVLRDRVAQCLRTLSIRYYNQLDDAQNAIRLAGVALGYAQTASCRTHIANDKKLLEYRALRDEAIALANEHQYTKAAEKLETAKGIVPEDERSQLEELLETCGRNAILEGVDTKQNSPTLRTVNGIGATFYGRRDYDKSSNSYITTHFFTFLFFPVVPLGAYRVVSTGANSYRIFGKVPLSKIAIWYRRLVLSGIAIFFLYSAIQSNTSSPSTSTVPSHSTQGYSVPSTPSTTYVPAAPAYNSDQTSKDWRRQEKNAIENERRDLDQKETQLNQMKQELKQLNSQIDAFEQEFNLLKREYPDGLPHDIYLDYKEKVRRHDLLVVQHNNLLEDYKSQAQQYDQDVERFNTHVREYNSQR